MKKLLKWEFRATSRQMIPLYLALGGMTALGVLFLLLGSVLEGSDTGRMILSVLTPFALITYIFVIAAVAIGTLGILLFRYYRNLIRDEGYLMHTLPVTPSQLVLSKFIAAYVWMLLSVLLILISFLILLASAAMIFGSGIYWRGIWQAIMNYEVLQYLLPFMLAILASCAASLLLYYAAISIGQCVTRHKVMGAIASYFGLYTAMQILNLLMMLVYFFIVAKTNVLWEMEFQISAGGADISALGSGLVLPFIITMALMYAVYSVVFYMISRYMLAKKLNLE